MSIAQQYIEGLKNAYIRAGDLSAEEWIHSECVGPGISAEGESNLPELSPAMTE